MCPTSSWKKRVSLHRASEAIPAGANRTTALDILICVPRVKKSVLETPFDQLKIPEAILMSKRITRWIVLKDLLPR